MMDGSKMRQDPKSPALSVGRSRSLRAEAAILKAATTLMEEKRPAQITAEAICKRAGVSKATLYKWWPSKIHVMLDAILKRIEIEVVVPDTGSAYQDYLTLLTNFAKFQINTPFGESVSCLFAEGANNQELKDLYLERYSKPRRAQLEQIWKRGVERGELRADTRSGLILDTLFGVLHYKQILGSHPVTEDTAKAVVDMIFSGIRTKDGSGS